MLQPPMSERSEFAALLEEASATPAARNRRLKSGDVVEVVVIQVGVEMVFVDAGTPGDGRIDGSEFFGKGTERPVKVGDRLRATVVDPRADGPLFTLALGRGGANVDSEALKLAIDNKTAVSGEVTRAVKAGLQVRIGSVTAFCPASQIERGHSAELESYVGQTLEFLVLEVRDGGRSVVVSRRALLDQERRQREQEALDNLKVGATITGTVSGLLKHGVLVDVGGVEGFIHISELAPHRVERPEDILSQGESVEALVQSIEQGPKGIKIRLSRKALAPVEQSGNKPAEEVMLASVTHATKAGVFVDTPKGSGLVPLGELTLAPGADHRRAYPAGTQLKVVLMNRDPAGRLRFSTRRVASVEERINYREFSSTGAQREPQTLGSLGDLLKAKFSGQLGKAAPSPAQTAPKDLSPEIPKTVRSETAKPETAKAQPAKRESAKPENAVAAKPRPKDPAGVIRRRR